MAIARWSPMRDLMQMQNDMNRYFSGLPVANGQEELSSGWTPQVDVFEDENGIHIEADVPGVDGKDIDVNVENGVLTLRGERCLNREDKKENYHRVERFHGQFTRSFVLPDYADTEKIEANSHGGVLEILIPKKAEKKPRQIKVAVK